MNKRPKVYTLTFMQKNGEYTTLMKFKEITCKCAEEDDETYCDCPELEMTLIPGFDKKIIELLNMWVSNKIKTSNDIFKLSLGQEPYVNLNKNETADYIIFNAPVPEEYRDLIKIDDTEEELAADLSPEEKKERKNSYKEICAVLKK